MVVQSEADSDMLSLADSVVLGVGFEFTVSLSPWPGGRLRCGVSAPGRVLAQQALGSSRR